MPERRRDRRYAVSRTAEASATSASAGFVVEVVNVSESGLGIVSVRDLEVGADYHFKLPDWEGPQLRGIVRWTESSGGPTYAGIEFVDLSEADRVALRALVSAIDQSDWGESM